MNAIAINYHDDAVIQTEQAAYYNLPYEFEGFMPITALRESKQVWEFDSSNLQEFREVNNKNGGYLSLELDRTMHAKRDIAYVPMYLFKILYNQKQIGRIELRIGYTEKTYYAGNISGEIQSVEKCESRELFARTCRLLIPLAKYHKMTCLCLSSKLREDKARPIFESLGAEYKRAITVPEHLEIQNGENNQRQIAFWRLTNS